MAHIKDQETINPSKSIALLSVKVSNTNHPNYHLELSGAFICPESESCAARSWFHQTENPYKSEKDSFNEYLLSFELDPGNYNVHVLTSYYAIPLLLRAAAYIPINLKFEVKPNSVIYLGHVDAVLREKRSDEKSASILPLIDAAIVGYSTGVFDVNLTDSFDSDMKAFNAEFPALKKVKVDKSIMSDHVEPMIDEE